MFDNQPPRMVGMMAARNLARSINDNPMSREPLTRPGDDEALQHQPDQPGHPHREWAEGFQDARILMHMQQSRNLALGKGLVLLYQTAPAETEAALVKMGKQAGETVCIAILAAILESEGTQYDIRCPKTVLAIYGAMKLQMSDKPPHCEQPAMQDFVSHVHKLAAILKVIFRRIDRGTIQLDKVALRNVLRDLTEMAALDQKTIASGLYRKQPCDACGGSGGAKSENSGQIPHHCDPCDGTGEKQPPA